MANKKRRLQHVPRKALQAAEVGNESELYFRQQQDTPVEHCIDNVGILLRAPPRRLVFFFLWRSRRVFGRYTWTLERFGLAHSTYSCGVYFLGPAWIERLLFPHELLTTVLQGSSTMVDYRR